MISLLRNLTPGQWLSLVVGVLSATAGATAQLTPVFGPHTTSLIVSVSNLIMTLFITPFLFAVTGQSGQIKAVQAMPGVSSIVVNEKANQTLAAIAVDPSSKVEAAPESAAAVANTAKGN